MAIEDNTTPRDASGNTNCNNEQQEVTVSKHPQYACKRPDYVLIEDCLEGEKWIKDKDTEYLPKTSAQKDDDAQGDAYEAYKERAIYYNFPQDTVDSALGMLQREPSTFNLPDPMQDLSKSATIDNETLQEVLANINESQLSYARYGLLIDVPDEDADIPYLVQYGARAIINWDERIEKGRKVLRMVTLDESKNVIGEGGYHTYMRRYRICALSSEGRYWTASLSGSQYSSVDFKDYIPPEGLENPYPNFKGKELDYVPFVFIGKSNLRSEPQVSPILDICMLSLAIYRKEADHAQAEFMQGQATPWGTGLTEADQDEIGVLGSTAMLFSGNPDAKFGFMEVNGDGLGEMSDTIEDLKRTVVSKSIAIMDKNVAESGKSLSIRASSSTSVLKTIAITAAEGMRTALAMISNWMDTGKREDLGKLPEDELSVVPNLDFVDDDNSTVADDFLKLNQAHNMGAPISKKSIHDWASKKELTSMTYDDEKEEIQSEGPAIPLPGMESE